MQTTAPTTPTDSAAILPASTPPRPRAGWLAEIPSGFLDALADSPVAFQAYRNFTRVLNGGHLAPRRRELIALAVAEIDGSIYGLSEHYQRAREMGLSTEEINEARLGRSEDPALDALLRFTVAVTLKRGDVSREDLETLRQAGVGLDDVGEIIANVAQCVFADYFTRVVRAAIDLPLLRPGADRPARRFRFRPGRPRRRGRNPNHSNEEKS